MGGAGGGVSGSLMVVPCCSAAARRAAVKRRHHGLTLPPQRDASNEFPASEPSRLSCCCGPRLLLRSLRGVANGWVLVTSPREPRTHVWQCSACPTRKR